MRVIWNYCRKSLRFLDFSLFEEHFALFSAPFTFDVAKAEKDLQMELLEIQLDSTRRAKIS